MFVELLFINHHQIFGGGVCRQMTKINNTEELVDRGSAQKLCYCEFPVSFQSLCTATPSANAAFQGAMTNCTIQNIYNKCKKGNPVYFLS